ncbi:MAG: hypothetical protein ACHREM_02365 [Polyangiales bacterium]
MIEKEHDAERVRAAIELADACLEFEGDSVLYIKDSGDEASFFAKRSAYRTIVARSSERAALSEQERTAQTILAQAAALGASEIALRLGAQLLGVPPCPKCDFRAGRCKCLTPDPNAGPGPTRDQYVEWAYAQTKLSNPDATREMAENAVARMLDVSIDGNALPARVDEHDPVEGAVMHWLWIVIESTLQSARKGYTHMNAEELRNVFGILVDRRDVVGVDPHGIRQIAQRIIELARAPQPPATLTFDAPPSTGSSTETVVEGLQVSRRSYEMTCDSLTHSLKAYGDVFEAVTGRSANGINMEKAPGIAKAVVDELRARKLEAEARCSRLSATLGTVADHLPDSHVFVTVKDWEFEVPHAVEGQVRWLHDQHGLTRQKLATIEESAEQMSKVLEDVSERCNAAVREKDLLSMKLSGLERELARADHASTFWKAECAKLAAKHDEAIQLAARTIGERDEARRANDPAARSAHGGH